MKNQTRRVESRNKRHLRSGKGVWHGIKGSKLAYGEDQVAEKRAQGTRTTEQNKSGERDMEPKMAEHAAETVTSISVAGAIHQSLLPQPKPSFPNHQVSHTRTTTPIGDGTKQGNQAQKETHLLKSINRFPHPCRCRTGRVMIQLTL